LLSQEVLDNFSLGKVPEPSSDKSLQRYKPNSHLSLLAMVDCWAHLGIQPFHHLALAATPLFRLFLGVAEHLFLNEELLDQSLCSALHDTWHRANDLEFVVASRGWSQCVSFGSFEIYKRRFETSRRFFEGRFEEANILGSEMLKAIMASEIERERSQ
jgi:prephenate dehydrogenase (NADP+)